MKLGKALIIFISGLVYGLVIMSMLEKEELPPTKTNTGLTFNHDINKPKPLEYETNTIYHIQAKQRLKQAETDKKNDKLLKQAIKNLQLIQN